jgi:predicted Rossmann fold nucleotide-binding protein DprA/Smf involved in DNA uptake
MKNLKKSLQSVNKDLNALSKKVDKIIVAASKLEKPKTVKKKAVKKVAVKKPAAKKAVKLTAADTMFAVIKRSKKGVGVAELMKKTEFDLKKTYNIIYKLKKQGKIKSVEKGVYKKA